MLHLTAFDAEDLNGLSVQLQDAVMTLDDVKISARRRYFALAANRFAWDALPEKQRRRVGVRFNHVRSARRLMGNLVNSETVLSLLALTFAPVDKKDDPSGFITLHFSGGHKIKLDVECIDVQLDDLGPAWGALREPHHDA